MTWHEILLGKRVWGNGVSFYLFVEKQRRMNHAVIGTDLNGTGLAPYAVVKSLCTSIECADIYI